MAVAFLDCHADQAADLRAFLARMYGPTHIVAASDAFFDWQFGRAKHGGPAVRLALLDDTIVGCLGYVPVELGLAGRVVNSAWLVNWMVDPEQRRLGLGPLLVRSVMRDFEVTLNIGPGADAQYVLTRMGWTHFGELPRYVHVLDPVATATLTESGRLEWPETLPISRPGHGRVSVRMIERFGDSVSELWDVFAQSDGAGTRRSAAYLNWRYADHPLGAYRLFEGRTEGQLTGIAVYRIEPASDRNVCVGRIVELFGEEETEICLIDAILADARPTVAMLDFFCSRDNLPMLMARMGFVRADHRATHLPILFQPIDHRRAGIPFMADLTKIGGQAGVCDWYVTKGDGDQDRPRAPLAEPALDGRMLQLSRE